MQAAMHSRILKIHSKQQNTAKITQKHKTNNNRKYNKLEQK